MLLILKLTSYPSVCSYLRSSPIYKIKQNKSSDNDPPGHVLFDVAEFALGKGQMDTFS